MELGQRQRLDDARTLYEIMCLQYPGVWSCFATGRRFCGGAIGREYEAAGRPELRFNNVDLRMLAVDA